MPPVGVEPTISMMEWEKTVHALDCDKHVTHVYNYKLTQHKYHNTCSYGQKYPKCLLEINSALSINRCLYPWKFIYHSYLNIKLIKACVCVY
jgi:hypothetical protein